MAESPTLTTLGVPTPGPSASAGVTHSAVAATMANATATTFLMTPPPMIAREPPLCASLPRACDAVGVLAGFAYERSSRDPSALRRAERAAQGPSRPGRVEHPRPRARRPRLHGGLAVAQPRRVLHRPRGDQGLPATQVGARARLRPAQGAVVLSGQPHLGALRVRVPRRRRPVV